jgi:hypothetical protein
MTLHDTVALAIVLACALAMLFMLRRYRKWRGADGEWIRKLAHIGTGLLSISLPWVFSLGILILHTGLHYLWSVDRTATRDPLSPADPQSSLRRSG